MLNSLPNTNTNNMFPYEATSLHAMPLQMFQTSLNNRSCAPKHNDIDLNVNQSNDQQILMDCNTSLPLSDFSNNSTGGSRSDVSVQYKHNKNTLTAGAKKRSFALAPIQTQFENRSSKIQSAPLHFPAPTGAFQNSLGADANFFFSDDDSRQFNNLVVKDTGERIAAKITARMDRGFFLADVIQTPDSTVDEDSPKNYSFCSNETSASSLEPIWTTYRRNYFQSVASFSLASATAKSSKLVLPVMCESDQSFIVTDSKNLNPQDLIITSPSMDYLGKLVGFEMSLTAIVHGSENSHIELIQNTTKREKGSLARLPPIAVRQASSPSLAKSDQKESKYATASTTVHFERVQFVKSTANNGKRKAPQQYYILRTNLYAVTDTGDRHLVSRVKSKRLVIRGRSPGHYASGNARPIQSSRNSPLSAAIKEENINTPTTSTPTVFSFSFKSAPHDYRFSPYSFPSVASSERQFQNTALEANIPQEFDFDGFSLSNESMRDLSYLNLQLQESIQRNQQQKEWNNNQIMNMNMPCPTPFTAPASPHSFFQPHGHLYSNSLSSISSSASHSQPNTFSYENMRPLYPHHFEPGHSKSNSGISFGEYHTPTGSASEINFF